MFNFPPPEDKFVTCGQSTKLQYSASRSLGFGSNGTCVYEGTFEGDPVAIKRIPRQTFTGLKEEMLSNMGEANINEAQILRQHVHSNVIRYHLFDRDDFFIFLALELCKGNLAEYIEYGKPEPLPSGDGRIIMKSHLVQGILNGIHYLHGCDIIHGDIKPQNILLQDNKSIQGHSTHEMKFNPVISDFGHSLRIDPGRKSKTAIDCLIGTEGWRPIEVVVRLEEINSRKNSDEMRETIKATKDVDIFAFGCIIQYVMAEKDDEKPRVFYMHPFGNESYRNNNIKKGSRLAYLSNRYPRVLGGILADLLIGICVDTNPQCRPNTKEIKDHPFFWKPCERYLFIEKVANSLNSSDDLCKLLDEKWKKMHPGSYAKEIENAVKYTKKRREKEQRYFDSNRCFSIYGLLKDIRNIKQHYDEIKKDIGNEGLVSDLGEGAEDDFYRYFLQKILQIVPVVYTCLYTIPRKDMRAYRAYFSDKEDSGCIYLREKVYWNTLDVIFP